MTINIMDYLKHCRTQESIDTAFSIYSIMDEAEHLNDLLDNRRLFMVVDKNEATIVLVDHGGFEDCNAAVFTMDEKHEWDASRCVGTMEMIRALCPHIDIDALIDKEDEDGVH